MWIHFNIFWPEYKKYKIFGIESLFQIVIGQPEPIRDSGVIGPGADFLLHQQGLPLGLLVVAVPDLGVEEKDENHSHGGSGHKQADNLARSLEPGHPDFGTSRPITSDHVSRVSIYNNVSLTSKAI